MIRSFLVLGLGPAVLLGAAPAQVAPAGPYFADPVFGRVWERTDLPVAAHQAARSWFWGPVQNSGPLREPFAGLPGGVHLVQYFDKSRMEINDPNGDRSKPFFVTNGLLTVELIGGCVQTRPDRPCDESQQHPSPEIPLAGDPADTLAPTYAGFRAVANSRFGDHPAPDARGGYVTATITRAGAIGTDPGKASVPGTKLIYYDAATRHNVPDIFWSFLNASGPVQVNGTLRQERLADPWFYASGLPISEAYWARATIAGQVKDVLIQAFERRVLTYTPTNDPAFRVEMGNIGLHYVQWRYPNGLPGQAVIYSSTGTGGQVCRGNANTPCVPADPAGPPPTAGYYDDLIRADLGGTLGARTLATRLRLLASSQVRLRARSDLSPGEIFILGLGQGLFDHRNGAGEVEVQAGDIRVQPIDTQFSISLAADGQIKIAVTEGDKGVLVSGRRRFVLERGQQVRAYKDGFLDSAELIDAETWRTWDIYGNETIPPNGPQGDPPACRGFQNAITPNLPPNPRLGCPVAAATVFDADRPGWVAVFAGGELLHDAVPNRHNEVHTVYAVYPDGTWESFAFTGRTPEDFRKQHARPATRLGSPTGECPAPPWALQRFTDGTLIGTRALAVCDLKDRPGLVLYTDGTWAPLP